MELPLGVNELMELIRLDKISVGVIISRTLIILSIWKDLLGVSEHVCSNTMNE